MSRKKQLLFALIPALVLIAVCEGFSRYLLSNADLCERLFGTSSIQQGYLRMALKGLTDVVVPDRYCGYRLPESTDPRPDRPPAVPMPDADRDAFRILCLGDSVTFGPGLETAEAWPARLEAILNGEFAERIGRRVVAYNAGVPGYGPIQCKRIYQSRYVALQPDVIYWYEKPALDEPLDLPPAMPDWTVRLTQLATRSHFIYLLLASRPGHSPNDPLRMFDSVIAPGAGPPASIDDFADWTKKAHGARAFIGIEYLDRAGLLDNPRWLWGNAADWDPFDTPVVRTLDSFRGAGPPSLSFKSNCHYNAAGADRLARLVAEDLTRRLDAGDLSVPGVQIDPLP